MNSERLFEAFSLVDDEYLDIADNYAVKAGARRKAYRSILVAAIIASFFTITAFAVGYTIHQRRQQELRQEMGIDLNNVQSYQQYEVPEEVVPGITLLSAIREPEHQITYINVSPIEPEEIDAFGDKWQYFFTIDGGQTWGAALPYIDPEQGELYGYEEIQQAIRESSYDPESKSLTMECYIFWENMEENLNSAGCAELCLARVSLDHGETQSLEVGHYIKKYGEILGTVEVPPEKLEQRLIRFEPFTVTEPVNGVEVTIHALELTATTAIWHLSYDGADIVHTPPQQDWTKEQRDERAKWEELTWNAEDYVGCSAVLHFADGTELSTGGALVSHFADGMALPQSGWGNRTIDIYALTGVSIEGQELKILE